MTLKCSVSSRCDNSDLLQLDNILLCRNCKSIFYKEKKFKRALIHCCNKQLVNLRSNIPYCLNCHRSAYVYYFSIN